MVELSIFGPLHCELVNLSQLLVSQALPRHNFRFLKLEAFSERKPFNALPLGIFGPLIRGFHSEANTTQIHALGLIWLNNYVPDPCPDDESLLKLLHQV